MPRGEPPSRDAVSVRRRADARDITSRLAKDEEWQMIIDRAVDTGDTEPVIIFLNDQLKGQMGIKTDAALIEDKRLIAMLEDCHEQPCDIVSTVFDILVDRLFDESWDKTGLESVFRPDQVVDLQSIMIEGLLKQCADSAIEKKVAEYKALYTEKAHREWTDRKWAGAVLGRRDDAASSISRASTSSSTSTLMSQALESVLTRISGNRRSGKGRADAHDRRATPRKDNARPLRQDRRDRRDRREGEEHLITDVDKTKENVRDFQRGDPMPNRSRYVRPQR